LSYLLSYEINNSNGMITYDRPNTLEFSPILGIKFKYIRFSDAYLRMTYGTWSSEGAFVFFNIAIMAGIQLNFADS